MRLKYNKNIIFIPISRQDNTTSVVAMLEGKMLGYIRNTEFVSYNDMRYSTVWNWVHKDWKE